MAKHPGKTDTLDLGDVISPGATITYRSGMSGVVLTVTAKGEMPIYTQDSDGRVIAHRASGRVADRVEGAYDIVPLRKALTIHVWLVQDATSGVMSTRCGLNHDPLIEPPFKIVQQWSLTHDLDA